MSAVQRLLRVLLCALVAAGVLLPGTAAVADPSPQEVERQLEKAHEDLEVVVEESNRITEELKATQASAAALNEKLAPLLGQLDAARADVAKIAAATYKNGGGLASAGYVLNSQSSNSVMHQVESMDRLARSRQREITTFTQTKEQYEREKKRLDDLLTAQQQQQRQLAEKRVKIEAELKRLEEMERRLEASRPSRPATGGGNTQTAAPPPSGSGKGAVAVRFAYAQLGKMYQWGAAGPNTFDCSGLTQQAWRAAGVGLPHNAAMQYRQTAKVSRSQLQPGDLVLYRGGGHIGLYIGNNQIIHASRTGRPIAVARLDASSPSGYSRPG